MRSRSSVALRRRLAVLTSCVSIAGETDPVAAAPAIDEMSRVRVEYHAPPECPGEDLFLSAVRERVGTAWEARPGELALTFDVVVTVATDQATASIDFVDAEGHRLSRSVSAAMCAEVVTGIALVTALAIESRVPKAKELPDPAPSAASSAPSAASPTPSAVSPTAAPVREPTPTSNLARSPRAERKAAPVPWHYDLGAAAVVSSGVGPLPAFGARLVAGVGWKRGPDVRIGFDYLATPATTVQEYGGVGLQTYELGGRVSACPFVFPVTAAMRFLPCAGVASGLVHGETRTSAGVKTPGSANPVFVLPLLELRADVELSAFYVEVGGEVKFSLDNPSFALKPPEDRTLYAVPFASFAGSLGLGVRL